MNWIAAPALTLVLSASAAFADDRPAADVEIRFATDSQTYRVRIGDALVVAKNAALTLTTGEDMARSGRASFSGDVAVMAEGEGHSLQLHCERAVYNFSVDGWIFEKVTMRQTRDGRTTEVLSEVVFC